MGVHEGHRERVKERFAEHGLNSFNDINSLELLLFYSIPRKDTNEIAHALLSKFESIDRVFEADIQDLMEVPGVGYNTAVLISLVPQLMKKAAFASAQSSIHLYDTEVLANYLIPLYRHEKEEVLYLLCLDNKGDLIKRVELGRGVVNSVGVSTRKIAETALRWQASSVIIAHNHPHGFANPSGDDILITRTIRESLRALDIPLEDHIVIAGNDYVSFRQTGYLNTI